MWNKPTENQLRKLPELYKTDNIPLAEKIIHQHYFIGGCDWYMAEFCPTDRIFFGYAILNRDLQNAEWGYTSLDDLLSIKFKGMEVDRDLYWAPKKFKDIEIPK